MAQKKKKNSWRDVKIKYRLMITNETHLNEVVSIRLSKLKLLLLAVFSFLFFFLLMSLLILFTPVKNFLPGYLDEKFRGELVGYSLLIDSLADESRKKDLYLNNIRDILQGNVKSEKLLLVDSVQVKVGTDDLKQSEKEGEFKKKFEEEEKYNLSLTETPVSNMPVFFLPVKGIVTSEFDDQKKHFGIDIATVTNEAVVAVLDGIVIYAGFDPNVGNIILLQHSNEFLSIYKHNAVVLKKEGDFVNGGDVIALSGNTGVLSTGSHLHFELWHKRKAVNPKEYIIF